MKKQKVYIVKSNFKNADDYFDEDYYYKVFSTNEKAERAFKNQIKKAKKEIKENFDLDVNEVEISEYEDEFYISAFDGNVKYWISIVEKTVN